LIIFLVLQIINADTVCGRCGNKMMTDNETEERFCGKCGFVVSETLQNSGPEWRSFSKEGGTDPARTGPSSRITVYWVDNRGKTLVMYCK
jgi:transcription initiation factor TFIIB